VSSNTMKRDIRYIGNYKILDILGKGGMSKLYTAIHVPLNRVVVIKEVGRNESRRRFKQEALICANLDHAHIVSLYDYFTIGNSCYIVMQYVEGVDLAHVIEQAAPLHPVFAALIARDVCMALQHAHENGIVHRDVKPTNILISQKGEVKITDFGVARGEEMPHLTSTGTVIGTPFYMSPEQADGRTLTGQSDIYSLGIVLYEMVTGKKPFTGTTAQAITAKVIRSSYGSPLWLDPHHSLRLSRIINKAMKKSLKRRYATAEHMCKDLTRYAGYRKIVHKEKLLADLLQTIEQSKQVTTMVRQPKKKKQKKKKRRNLSIFLYIALIIILFLLIYYMIHLLRY
jgi:serine/threonine protein kinase